MHNCTYTFIHLSCAFNRRATITLFTNEYSNKLIELYNILHHIHHNSTYLCYCFIKILCKRCAENLPTLNNTLYLTNRSSSENISSSLCSSTDYSKFIIIIKYSKNSIIHSSMELKFCIIEALQNFPKVKYTRARKNDCHAINDHTSLISPMLLRF